jgi:8-amino-7-oxononanoate synthase
MNESETASKLAPMLLDAVRSHAEAQSDRLAYSFIRNDGESSTLTFNELSVQAQQLAVHLSELAKPGDRALLTYPPGLEFVKAFLACLFAGIIAVPAYVPKKNRNAARVLGIALDCDPTLLLCSDISVEAVKSELASHLPAAHIVSTDDLDLSLSPAAKLLPCPKPADIAFLQYTSGSTATPRGVIVSHANIAANEESIRVNFEHTQDSIKVSWLPMFHDMGLIGGILQPLFVGFHSVLMAPGTFMRQPIRWLQTISEFGGTTSGGPDFAFEYCAKKISDDELDGIDLSSWQTAYNGSEPVRAETLDSFSRKFASCGFRPQTFFPCYGLAESTLFVSGGPAAAIPNRVRLDTTALAEHRITEPTNNCSHNGSRNGLAKNAITAVSCGQRANDLEIAVVQPSTLNRCGVDQVGEIWLTGPSIALGYWNQPGSSEENFKARLKEDSRHWLRTGDLGFLRAGELFVTGRRKDLIIIRGRNLYPSDIERLVEQSFDFVEPNTCAAFADERNGIESLVVVIEANRELVRIARESMPEAQLKLAPSVEKLRDRVFSEQEVSIAEIVFVRPTTFPRTSSGKVQRRRCRQLFQNEELEVVVSISSQIAPSRCSDSANPATRNGAATEQLLDDIYGTIKEWAIDENRRLSELTPQTTFASLGIDSVAATELGLRIEKTTGIRVETDALFEQRTIGGLANYLAQFGNALANQSAKPNAGRSIHTREEHSSKPRSDYLEFFRSANRRFIDLREAGHDYFGTPSQSRTNARVVIDNHEMLMLAAYDYLGLSGHSDVPAVVSDAVHRSGSGGYSARLLGGTSTAHRELESELSEFMGTEDAIVFASGYVTNLASISAIVSADGVVIGDELNHASIVDGCKFSGGTFETFRHNDMQHLEQLLQVHSGKRILVAVDAVYSMDGDIAPVPSIVELARKYGALLMVDEAHSLGVLGKTGRGVQEHFGLPADAIDIKMGTLSKAIASCGGFVAAHRDIVDFLKHQARGYIFSAALPAPQVAAARKCLEIMQDEPHRPQRLREIASRMTTGLRDLGYNIPATETPIIPILFDSEEETLNAVSFCRKAGLFVVPVFYPAVPMNSPRIRLTVMASFTDSDIDQALDVFSQLAVVAS